MSNVNSSYISIANTGEKSEQKISSATEREAKRIRLQSNKGTYLVTLCLFNQQISPEIPVMVKLMQNKAFGILKQKIKLLERGN